MRTTFILPCLFATCFLGLSFSSPALTESTEFDADLPSQLHESAEPDLLSQLHEFKQNYTAEELRVDTDLLKSFASLHARAYGLELLTPDQIVDRTLSTTPALATSLDHHQLVTWRRFLSLGWDPRIEWDATRGTPVSIRPGILFEAADAQQAQDRFEQRLGPTLRALFRMPANGERSLLDQRDLVLPPPHGNGPSLRVRQLRFEHRYGDLPVFGDRIVVTLIKRESSDHWSAAVSARWTLLAQDRSPHLSAKQAVAVAQKTVPAARPDRRRQPVLGFWPSGTRAQLAWDVRYRDGRVPQRMLISALDGAVLDTQDLLAANHSGALRAETTRPYLTAPEVRPMPFLSIYEDSVVVPKQDACYFTPGFDTQTIADTAKLNATTDYHGTYALAAHDDPFDLSWVVDFQGTFAEDVSPYPNRVLDGVPAGTDYSLPAVTDAGANRRAQLFYLTTYAGRIYDAYAVPQYAPLGIHFDALGMENTAGGACLDDDVQTSCCGGSSEAGCYWLECDMGPTGSPAAERRFREVAAHEQVHTLAFYANGGTLCSGCGGSPDSDGAECACWEEGRADFGAIAMNQFEKHRADYRPDLRYPEDWGGASLYGPGAIFTSIYVDYMLRTGLEGMLDVERNLDLIDSDTRMVGSCTSLTDISTCPANSFYRHLIDNRDQWAFPRWRNTQEISAVFHEHVTDADRGVAGEQAFPWADELQNRIFSPPLLYTDLAATSTVTAQTGNDGGGNIRLNDADDWDTVMFLARSGESYTVRTHHLAPGVDTRLEVRTIDADQSHLVGENDDCGAGPDSCLNFVAAETGMHRVIVTSQPGTTTGAGATYRISVDLDDDNGDTLAEASAFAPDDVMHMAHGNLETAADVDVFRVVVPTDQILGFSVCSTGESSKVDIELLDAFGTVLSSKQNRKCDKVPKQLPVTAGTYYLRVFSKSGEAVSYGLRVALESTDLDADDLPTNAYPVDADVGIGTVFEHAGDEDWYRISAPQGGHYSVEVVAVDPSVDPLLEVYAPNGTLYSPAQLPDTSGHSLGHWMMRNDDGGLRGNDARSIFWTPVSGDYLLRVMPDTASGAGRYHLLVHDNSGFTEAYPAYP